MVRGNNDLYRRLTATINAEYQIKPWLKVGTTNQIEKYNARSVSEGSEYGSMMAAVLSMDPLTPLHTRVETCLLMLLVPWQAESIS